MAAVSRAGAQGELTTRIDAREAAAKESSRRSRPGSDALILEAGRDARSSRRSIATRPRSRPRSIASQAQRRRGRSRRGGRAGRRPAAAARRDAAHRRGHRRQPRAARRRSPAPRSRSRSMHGRRAEIENAAIVRVDVRSGHRPGARARAGAGASSWSPTSASSRATLYVTMRQENASDVLASRRVLVQPGERLPVVLTFHPSPGDYRRGSSSRSRPHDALRVDDMAYGRVPAGDKLPVVLASATARAPRRGSSARSPRDPMVSILLASTALARGADGRSISTRFVVIDGACPASPPGGDLSIVNPPAWPVLRHARRARRSRAR